MADDKSIFEYEDNSDPQPKEAEVVPEIPEGIDELPKYEPPKIDRKTSIFGKGGEYNR